MEMLWLQPWIPGLQRNMPDAPNDATIFATPLQGNGCILNVVLDNQ